MAGNRDKIYVTYVEPYNNGLLKIWGQQNRTCALFLEKHLAQTASDIKRSPRLSPSSIQKGMNCLAKLEDDSYHRARIISEVIGNTVIVLFIDYGHKDRVNVNNLKIIPNASDNVLATMIPQAEGFILANIRSEIGWTQDVINEIRRGVCYSEYKCRVICQAGNEKVIQISYKNDDYSSFLIRQDFARPVSVKEQMMLLRNTFRNPSIEPMGITFRNLGFNQQLPQSSNRDKYFHQNKVQLGAASHIHAQATSMFHQPQNRAGISRNFNPILRAPFNQGSNPQALADPKIENLASHFKQQFIKDQYSSVPVPETLALGYVTQVLDVKTAHNVYISYIDDGPWSFSVQLVANEHELNQLMEDLAAYTFKPIRLPLVPGSPCIARSQKYDSYCRGVLLNISHSAVRVFYVDFGNTEDLPYNMLFEFPPIFFRVKTMSQKFALSGLQKVKPTEEIKKAFVEVVENELLILHVTNLEGENLPTCDLYLKDVNIKRILNDKLRLVKNWEPAQFPRSGEVEYVLVTCVETPQRFFVQLKRCEPELSEIKADLAKYGPNAELLDPEDIVPAGICICYYARENQWLRAVITSVNPMKSATVFYVDYGYTEMVDIKMLRKVCGGAVAKNKVQAIPCCLHGYEGGYRQASNTSALSELILGKELNLKVISEGNERINVQLFDNGKDVLITLNASYQSKPKTSTYDTKENSNNYALDNERLKDSVRTIQSFNGKNGPERVDFGRSRDKNDPKPEKVRSDALSWRLDDRKNPRDAWEPSSETRNDRYNGSRAGVGKPDDSKAGRYGFKGKKVENGRANDKDPKDLEKNWRGIDNLEVGYSGEATGVRMKLGETINDRMKRAARENEERGLKISETLITRLPVKLENMAFGGKILENREVKIGSTEEVLVTYFVNPQEIYVQLASSKEKFRKFMLEIRDYYRTKLPMLNKPKKGDVVMAKFKADGVLYRAIVIESDPITVQYVDFGNEEVSERENLWPMDRRFLELESQCLRCILPNLKPVASEIWPAPNSEIDRIFEYETYSCTFLRKTENGYEVKLLNVENGRDVREELISAGFAYSDGDPVQDPVPDSVEDSVRDSFKDSTQELFQASDDNPDVMFQPNIEEYPLPMIKVKQHPTTPFDLLRDEVYTVFVTHIVDATEFYVQIWCSESRALEKDIANYINGNEFYTRAGHVIASVGNLCLVNVEGDTWYRAKVIEKGEANITVSLMDHGYELPVDREQIGPISNSIAQYPPQALRCCLLVRENKPIDELNEMFPSSVKNYYSAFFHEESENGYKITLYDSYGEKLKILSNYNSAPDWIRPIPDLPIIKRHMQVTVSHINSPQEVYVQLLEEIPELKRMTSLMMTFYSEELPEMTGNLSEFEMYAVKSPADGIWYRAQLTSHDEETATMFYIDYGNSEEVPRENLRSLDPSFYEWYAYAKKASLNLQYQNTSEKRITLKLQQLIGKQECLAVFLKPNENLHGEFLLENSFLTSLLVSGSVQNIQEEMFEEYKNKAWVEEIKVYISHVTSPDEFWVHEERICPTLSEFQDKLQEACSNGKPKEKGDVSVGDIVGVLFKDNLWYRAFVTAVENDNVSIRFLDYGNTFDVDKTENEFIILEDELKKRRSFARKCSLQGSWKTNAAARFEEIVLGYHDRLDLVEIDHEGDIVDLLLNGCSITEQLIDEGYEKSASANTVFITHINSPNDFYIQKEIDQDLFDMVIERMMEVETMPAIEDVVVDELYCAEFPEDGLWYRAKVICKDKEEIVVNFIDYGNCSVTTEIKELPDDLKTLRPLSKNCCLANIKQKDTWSEEAKDYLGKFLNNVPLKMEIIQETADIDVIRLRTKSGEDLSEVLIGLDEGVDQVAEDEPTVGDIINGGEQSPPLLPEGTVSPDAKDSCPSRGSVSSKANSDVFSFGKIELPERSRSFSEFNTETVASELSGQGESSYKESEKSENVRKLTYSMVVAGDSFRRLSLEDVSGRVKAKSEEKLTDFSPITSAKPGRQQEEDEQELDGVTSNGCESAAAGDEISGEEKVITDAAVEEEEEEEEEEEK